MTHIDCIHRSKTYSKNSTVNIGLLPNENLTLDFSWMTLWHGPDYSCSTGFVLTVINDMCYQFCPCIHSTEISKSIRFQSQVLGTLSLTERVLPLRARTVLVAASLEPRRHRPLEPRHRRLPRALSWLARHVLTGHAARGSAGHVHRPLARRPWRRSPHGWRSIVCGGSSKSPWARRLSDAGQPGRPLSRSRRLRNCLRPLDGWPFSYMIQEIISVL
jgi:hypothetical protein